VKEKAKIFLQQNWFKVSFLLILVIVIGGFFYWFQWRPTQIKKECQRKIENHDGELSKNAIRSRLLYEEGDIYDFCLRQQGLDR